MDGMKLAAAIRDRWPPIEIIVVSGHVYLDISELPEGSRFFRKPYDAQAVIDAMRDMVA
jgi:FixJ family two-component response regulator